MIRKPILDSPAPPSTRAQQTERAYRNFVRLQLIDLLKVINPQDTIQFQAMKYSELVAYARDWLQTEVDLVTEKPAGNSESVQSLAL